MDHCEDKSKRTGMEVMLHHISTLATGDVDSIMADYSEDLIAMNYGQGSNHIVVGKKDLREQINTVFEIDGGPTDLEASPMETQFLQGIGDYAVINLQADPGLKIGAHTYIARNGVAVYTTGYHDDQLTPDSYENAGRHRERSAESDATMKMVNEYIEALTAGDLNRALAYLAEEATLITNVLDDPIIIGRSNMASFWKDALAKGCNYHREPSRDVINDAEGGLCFKVFDNEQGSTAETYLVEKGKIVFVSLIHRTF